MFGIGFDPCGALPEGPPYAFGRGGAAGSLEAMAISMMLSCPHPLQSMRLRSSSGRAAILCGFVVVDVDDRVFERLW